MIADLQPYSAMKDSGVEWLGDVPEHWEVVPNRALFNRIKDRDCPDEQMLSVTIKKGVIRQSTLLEITSKKDSSNLDRSNYKLVQPGGIAYDKMRAWQGAIGASYYRGIISPAYVVQRPRACSSPGYFHQLFRISTFAKEVERWSYGITSNMLSLRPEHFKLIYSCLPPLPEQAAIVRYLDHVDRRVRWYVRAKQKLIELLEEQKQAIIHRAVTRGLDPDVPLKGSGVEWLGEVPEHWEVKPIKRAFITMDYGISDSATDDGTIRLLTMGHIKDGNISVPADGGVSTVDEELVLQPNDLLFNRTNSADLVTKVGLFRGGDTVVTFAPNLVRMRPTQQNDPEYLNLFLNDRSTLSAARREAIPSLHQSNLNPTRYGRLNIALPPLSEQVAIVRSLNNATVGPNTAIDRTRREIELLREYRTRLIADVVTGKLDVREAATNLPAEPDEPGTLDDAENFPDNDEECKGVDIDVGTEEAEA